MRDQSETGKHDKSAAVPPVPGDSFVPQVDLAAIAEDFGMRRAAAYLRAMGNQLPVRVTLPD